MNVMHFKDYHHPHMPDMHHVADDLKHIFERPEFWALVGLFALGGLLFAAMMIGGVPSDTVLPDVSPFMYGY
jgi:hypothetical protein